MRYAIIVPTLNAGFNWDGILNSIIDQILAPERIIIIDSMSTDRTVEIAKSYGCTVILVDKEEFGHGRTRQIALTYAGEVDFVVFLTQDAFLVDNNSVKMLINVFKDEEIGAVYGKQLPRESANILEKFERTFTYPVQKNIYSYSDRKKYGVKACFLSNAYTAYTLSALVDIGGFPENIIVSEDMYVGAKLLKAGWKLAYCAEAAGVHSHS